MSPRPPAPPRFLLFSGHNDRAVVTLCRYFRERALPYALVAAGRDDAIHRTDHAGQVLFNRLDRVIDLPFLQGLAGGEPTVYVPTTEFINHFVLAHRSELQAAGWLIGLPAAAVYAQLTGKLASQAVVQGLTGLRPPAAQALEQARPPCVLKPRENLQAARVLYPQLCLTPEALTQALAGIEPAQWFAQDYIDGQSHYLCGYLACDGQRAWYWQDNLLQQPGGKSILLARTGANPGLDADALFDGLARLGYHGPFMMELIRDAAGRLHYIEINPRFWGPLQLALDACPRVLDLFAADHGVPLPPRDGALPATGQLYAWAHGAAQAGCRHYPALQQQASEASLPALLARHDIYARPDTQALHGQH